MHKIIIEVKDLKTGFSEAMPIHNNLNLIVKEKEIHALVGASGAGKSILLKVLLGLIKPCSGKVRILGLNPFSSDQGEQDSLREQSSVLFQDGALFSSLNVFENLAVPLMRWRSQSKKWIKEQSLEVLEQVGLTAENGLLYPSELSGGMRKRAALARALILKPKLVFLDEPTAGLDPISASAFDELVLDLRQKLGLSFFVITHDLDTIYHITDNISVLCHKKIETGTFEHFQKKHLDPWVRNYFQGERAMHFKA